MIIFKGEPIVAWQKRVLGLGLCAASLSIGNAASADPRLQTTVSTTVGNTPIYSNVDRASAGTLYHAPTFDFGGAAALASFGVLKVATAINTNVLISGESATASAQASWQDEIVFNTVEGGSGTAYIPFIILGDLQSPVDGAFQNLARISVVGSSGFEYLTTSLVDQNGTSFYSTSINQAPAGGTSPFSTWMLAISFTSGAPVTINASAECSTGMTHGLAGSCNLGNSVYWGGVQSVKAMDGSSQTLLSTTSASGTDYSHSFLTAVPEPAPWGMMIAGFGLVGCALRRRSNAKVLC